MIKYTLSFRYIKRTLLNWYQQCWSYSSYLIKMKFLEEHMKTEHTWSKLNELLQLPSPCLSILPFLSLILSRSLSPSHVLNPFTHWNSSWVSKADVSFCVFISHLSSRYIAVPLFEKFHLRHACVEYAAFISLWLMLDSQE